MLYWLQKQRKGIIDTNLPQRTFWYRLVAELAALVSAAIIALWFADFLVPSQPALAPLAVSVTTLVASIIVLTVALPMVIIRRFRANRWYAAIISAILSATLILAIESTSGLMSPYAPLWSLSALLSATTGPYAIIPLVVMSGLYALSLLLEQQLTATGWVVFFIGFGFPVILGLFIWLRRHQLHEGSTQAVSELATELNEESNKSSIIIGAIADGVLLLDKQGMIELINPAAKKIIGWGEEDALRLDYRSVLKLLNGKGQPLDEQLDPVQQCLKVNEVVITEKFSIQTVAGKQVLVSVMASPLQTAGGGVIVVFRDITAQRAEERGQAEFISTASHEMRTPVAAIEGYLGLALNPSTATIDEKARSFITKAQESATRLGRLFQDLLDISKLEDGRLDSTIVPIDILDFSKNVTADFDASAREKGLGLIYLPATRAAGDQTLTPIYYGSADRDHLHEVFSNLLTNAIKYTKTGNVTVDVGGDDHRVVISVKDSGIGIPAEDLPHLFQKFYRVDNSDTREIGGTGLGLYLSRQLMETMGGHLNVESVYGQGSTFTIDLPRVSKEQAEAPATTTPTPPAQPV